MSVKTKILIVDDQPEILNSLEQLFKTDYGVIRASSGAEALHVLKDEKVAVILSDQRMPRMSGVEFLRQSLEIQPDAVRILITAYADLQASIEAINQGHIYNYVSKPWEPEELILLMRRAVEKYELVQSNKSLAAALKEANQRLETENIQLHRQLETKYDFSNIIGHSPRMLEMFKLVSKAIDTPTTILLLGETGTGKELLAKAIHYNSKRREKMFLAQNCGALPETLLESELFGHVRGAFTGAVTKKRGLFELANSGTVFLDEIGDTSPALQLRLLRVLQEGEFRPVGGSTPVYTDVRIVAATNKDLEQEVREGRFREDLYYRLAVFPVHLPPLRQRKGDIPDLAEHFIHKYSKRIGKTVPGIDAAALTLLQNAGFPGNIRELENEIERAVTLADDGTPITPHLLSPRFHGPVDDGRSTENNERLKNRVENLEIEMIRQMLQETHGNIALSAERLGLSRAGLYKKLHRYGLDADKQ